MSKKANPTIVGFFVVVGLALAAGGVVLFGSAGWFAPTEQYILYFDASLLGLNPGAPVKFRGVTIGSVKDVLIRFQQAEQDLHMPVIIEINEDLMQAKSDRTIRLDDTGRINELIERGLRARLQAQSLVTGLLFVELEVIPGAPPPVFHQQKKVYKEVPTISTDIQQLLSNLAQLDIKELSDKLTSILDKLDTSLGELQVREISQGITNLLVSVRALVVSPDMTNSLAAVASTLEEYRHFAETLRSKVDPLSGQAASTLEETRRTLAELRMGTQDLRDLVAPEAPFRTELVQALDQLGHAAKSLADLAEFLNRNPNAILSGRKPPQPAP